MHQNYQNLLKKVGRILCGLFFMVCAGQASAASNTLEGDEGLACAAILCLSSSVNPAECAPSLERYFNITGEDFIKDRLNFLNLCPACNDPGMPELINAIVNGAGQCDAKSLNIRLQTQVEVPNPEYTKNSCQTSFGQMSIIPNKCDNIPPTITKTVIDDKMPANCKAYVENSMTDLKLRYVGDKLNGGKWVD